jgi:hypothetical protein
MVNNTYIVWIVLVLWYPHANVYGKQYIYIYIFMVSVIVMDILYDSL